MDEALDARRCASRASRAGPWTCTASKRWRPRSAEDADAANYRIGAGERRREPRLVIEAGIDERDLADIAQWAQEAGISRVAAHHRDHRPLRRQPLHDVASDEAGTAKHGRAP